MKYYAIESLSTRKHYKVLSDNMDNAIAKVSKLENRSWGNCSSQVFDSKYNNRSDYIILEA